MTKSTKASSEESKPQYVVDLEESYGPPSEEGFGAAVFFIADATDDDLEELALAQYKHFVGELWERWGEEAWMTPWKQVYTRKKGTKPDVAKELRGIEDFDAKMAVPLVLEIMEDPDKANEALAAAYNDPAVADLRAYTIGDGNAMSGLLLVGRRENGEATVLTVLMD